MPGEDGRIQGGPWRARLAVVARLRLVSAGLVDLSGQTAPPLYALRDVLTAV